MTEKVNFEFRDIKEHNNIMAMTAGGNVKGFFYGSETHDFGSLADGAGETGSVTVNGVALGDIVVGVSCSVDLQDMTLTAYVQAANTVEYRLQNESGGTVNLAAATIRVLIADVT